MAAYQQQPQWPEPQGPDDDGQAAAAPAERVHEWRGPTARRLLQGGVLLAAAALLLMALYARTPTESAAEVELHPANTVTAPSKRQYHDSHRGKGREHAHDAHGKGSGKGKGKDAGYIGHSGSSARAHVESASTRAASGRKVDNAAGPAAGAGAESASSSKDDVSIINSNVDSCAGPYPGYPYCEDHVQWMLKNWNVTPDQEAFYRSKGVDGTRCSILNYLNLNGFYCPEAADFGRKKIRGVNLGGWLVLEPWITPSLFEQFDTKDMIEDHWKFCEKLGKKECRRQLEKHWDSFVTESDLRFLAESGINHVRIPVGYWMFGDIRADEPWVDGELPYLERVINWCHKVGLHVILDLHAAPGSQNGFDNSGKKGEVHFHDSEKTRTGRTVYPNIIRALEVIANLSSHFSTPEFSNTVVGIELVNEAFVTIPIEVVKDYYLQGYAIIQATKAPGSNMAVIIGDSFRFGAWNDFMFPPHYRHVWIDTHIYQMFDHHRLSMTWKQHITQTCKLHKPEVAVAPLSTMVGEWSLATTDCAVWLNGYNTGSRFDGTFKGQGAGPGALGSCLGANDITNKTIWTPEYKAFLFEFASKQMDAYESGSSSGWFFWNFKTEKGAPQWNYILGVKEGWIPKDLDNRKVWC